MVLIQPRVHHSLAFDYNVSEADTLGYGFMQSMLLAPRNSFYHHADTDTYHIGLPLLTPTDQVMVQISKLDKELKLLNLQSLSDALKRDPDLAHIPESAIPQTIQTLFVATGCDFVSFFSGLGKPNFFKVFMEHTQFILADHPKAFSTSFTSSILHQQTEETQLAFIRLVGCAYFKKHSNAFFGTTPQSLFNGSAANSPTEQHIKWLDHLREGIWDKITQESEQIPSFTALQLHWKRSCWITHLWQQPEIVLATMHGNGWTKEANGELEIVWETEEKRKK